MIPGFDHPVLAAGAPLSALVSGVPPLARSVCGESLPDLDGRVARCARALLERGVPAEAPARVFFVPGRIEVLGKHTDYAGGRSLLAAVERGFLFVSVPRSDRRVEMVALDEQESADFPLSTSLTPLAGWRNYPMTVARRLTRDLGEMERGVAVALQSDLPSASGMSSSSALVVGSFLCLASAADVLASPRFRAEVASADDLASYLAAVESGQGFGGFAGDAGVGTHGGSEDHTAILRARAGSLLQYGFVPAALEREVPLPAGYRFALASSGIAAEKTGAMKESYNRAAALVRRLREIWAEAGGAETGSSGGSLAAILRSSVDAPERLRRAVQAMQEPGFPRADLLARLEHFLTESEVIIPAAATALAAGKLDRFGELVDESQRGAERLLGNQIPETIELARSARRLGAVAASAFGAGYGGSVWALLPDEEMETFLASWRDAYAARFPHAAPRAAFFPSRAAPGARRIV